MFANPNQNQNYGGTDEAPVSVASVASTTPVSAQNDRDGGVSLQWGRDHRVLQPHASLSNKPILLKDVHNNDVDDSKSMASQKDGPVMVSWQKFWAKLRELLSNNKRVGLFIFFALFVGVVYAIDAFTGAKEEGKSTGEGIWSAIISGLYNIASTTFFLLLLDTKLEPPKGEKFWTLKHAGPLALSAATAGLSVIPSSTFSINALDRTHWGSGFVGTFTFAFGVNTFLIRTVGIRFMAGLLIDLLKTFFSFVRQQLFSHVPVKYWFGCLPDAVKGVFDGNLEKAQLIMDLKLAEWSGTQYFLEGDVTKEKLLQMIEKVSYQETLRNKTWGCFENPSETAFDYSIFIFKFVGCMIQLSWAILFWSYLSAQGLLNIDSNFQKQQDILVFIIACAIAHAATYTLTGIKLPDTMIKTFSNIKKILEKHKIEGNRLLALAILFTLAVIGGLAYPSWLSGASNVPDEESLLSDESAMDNSSNNGNFSGASVAGQLIEPLINSDFIKFLSLFGFGISGQIITQLNTATINGNGCLSVTTDCIVCTEDLMYEAAKKDEKQEQGKPKVAAVASNEDGSYQQLEDDDVEAGRGLEPDMPEQKAEALPKKSLIEILREENRLTNQEIAEARANGKQQALRVWQTRECCFGENKFPEYPKPSQEEQRRHNGSVSSSETVVSDEQSPGRDSTSSGERSSRGPTPFADTINALGVIQEVNGNGHDEDVHLDPPSLVSGQETPYMKLEQVYNVRLGV